MEDISQSFLSSADSLRKMAAYLGTNPSFSKPEIPLLLPVFCSSSGDAASFFSCNLSFEIARRNKTVLVIDFGLERPNIRYLMGNLVDLQNDFPANDTCHPDFKVETIKLYGFSKITLVSLAASAEHMHSRQIIERIFAGQSKEQFDIILINSLNGPDDLLPLNLFTHFHRALFLMDSRIHSLLNTYSWIKKSLPLCQSYHVGAVSYPDEETARLQENAAKLEKVVSKYLSIDPAINPDELIANIPLGQEAIHSIRIRKPLALSGSSSSSIQAISNLCENLLSSE